MNPIKIILPLTLSALLTTQASAQIASDVASNYAGFNNGDNNGFGFTAWDLTNNNNNGTDVFAGYFIGNSTDGTGDINTSGVAFGMYANPSTAFATAVRGFNTALTTGQTFSIDLGVNFRNGNKGINIRDVGGNNLFNFNVGSDDYQVNNTTLGLAFSTTSTFTLSFEQKAGTNVGVTVTRFSSDFGTEVAYSADLDFGAAMDNFELYITDTVDGANANNLYFNNLEVVPEPGTFALLLGLASLGCIAMRRR